MGVAALRNGVIDRNELKVLLESLDGGNENILEVGIPDISYL